MTKIVKICNTHGPKTIDECKLRKYTTCSGSTYVCKECVAIYRKRYREKNLEHFKEVCRAYSKEQCATLTDRYIRQVLRNHEAYKEGKITQEQIQRKREQLIKLREWRNE